METLRKYVPCVCCVSAGLVVAIAIICKLAGAQFFGMVSARGMLIFAGVVLLFGINHRGCPKTKEGA